MAFQDAYHSNPHAPTGQELTFKLPATLNQGLKVGQLGGRRRKVRGGFYPSIMGGVVQNAPLLAPLAARQGLRLLEEYKLLARRPVAEIQDVIVKIVSQRADIRCGNRHSPWTPDKTTSAYFLEHSWPEKKRIGTT
jgi:hypothetical protein